MKKNAILIVMGVFALAFISAFSANAADIIAFKPAVVHVDTSSLAEAEFDHAVVTPTPQKRQKKGWFKRVKEHFVKKRIQKFLQKLPADSLKNDVIILLDGEELEAKVLEVREDIVKYKQADNLNGPTISIPTSSIFMIKYPNGTKHMVPNDKKIANEQASRNAWIIGFVLGILTNIFGVLLAFIFYLGHPARKQAVRGALTGLLSLILVWLLLAVVLTVVNNVIF